MTDTVEEKVVMTPKCKTATSTTLVIERKAVEPEASDKIHVAGGDHTGIIINKENIYGMLQFTFPKLISGLCLTTINYLIDGIQLGM